MGISHLKFHNAYAAPFPQSKDGIEALSDYPSEIIGQGAAGQVRRVDMPGQSFALKELHDKDSKIYNTRHLWYLKREAALLTWLHHPNIVNAYARWRSDGDPVVAMELLGLSLSELKPGGWRCGDALSFGIGLYIVREIAKALNYLHSKGSVHADVAPKNVLLERPFDTGKLPRVVLCDFALTQRVGGVLSKALCGTPRYAPIEVWEKKPRTEKADVFALGCILYELVTTGAQYEQRSAADVYLDLKDGDKYERIRANTEMPPSIKDLVESILLSSSIFNGFDLLYNIDRTFPAIRKAKTVEDLTSLAF